ncbi:protoglobin protein [Ceratobasidium sp. AG-Ba]|nr:protoglobin protein [Ceratobasidium sp. AG-Ba]
MTELPDPTDPNPSTIHVDREALYTSLPDRVSYLTNFLEFNESDADTLNEAALILEPLIPMLVDRVYAHLFKFSVTKEIFMPRPSGHEGPMVADISHLTLDDDQIKERKRFFTVYLKRLITSDYNDFRTWEYYDKVGRMHTGEAGLKHRKLAGKEGFRVDHIHLSGLLGWTMDQIIVAVSPSFYRQLPLSNLDAQPAQILRHETLPLDKKETIVRSLHKVMWIQQDLFSRHYVRDGEKYQKSPRALAGSKIRQRPTGTGDTCPYTAAAAATSGSSTASSPNMSSVNRRPSGSAGSSTTSSVTGAESVAWNPQPGGTYTPESCTIRGAERPRAPHHPRSEGKNLCPTWMKWSVNPRGGPDCGGGYSGAHRLMIG